MYFVPFDLLNIYRCKERKYTKGNPIVINNTESKHLFWLRKKNGKEVLTNKNIVTMFSLFQYGFHKLDNII